MREQQVPPLRSPDFLLDLAALLHFMRPSLRKGAYAALSSAAWQEIRVRSGRDLLLYLSFSQFCTKKSGRSQRNGRPS
jgi:hypothetical protein